MLQITHARTAHYVSTFRELALLACSGDCHYADRFIFTFLYQWERTQDILLLGHDSNLKQATTASFHVLCNVSFTCSFRNLMA
jgi:hypothetical protein